MLIHKYLITKSSHFLYTYLSILLAHIHSLQMTQILLNYKNLFHPQNLILNFSFVIYDINFK